MRKFVLLLVVLTTSLIVALSSMIAQESRSAAPAWAINSTIIEACSCPMFCQCYFNAKPASHAGHASHSGGEHYCRFNNAFRVNKGRFGNTRLDGAKFWVAGDLGGDFSMGQMDWAVLTYDPSVTKEQREGIQTILGAVYPVKWNAFSIAPDAAMEWNATKDRAVAKLDGGRVAEVVLKRFQGNTDEPIVIRNLKYWGTPRNDGFIMMPNEVEAYRAGSKAFEYKGTNGFMITIDMASSDVKAAK